MGLTGADQHSSFADCVETHLALTWASAAGEGQRDREPDVDGVRGPPAFLRQGCLAVCPSHEGAASSVFASVIPAKRAS